MRIRGGQDIATGVLFIAIAAVALYVGRDYPMGTLRAPSSGVLPKIVSWGLVIIGSIIILKGLVAGGQALTAWDWRPVILVFLACAAFARLVDSLGMVVTMAISMTLCALGTPETRWPEYLAFAVLMIFIGWGLFVWALGMPIPTWPVKVPPDVQSVIDLFRGPAR